MNTRDQETTRATCRTRRALARRRERSGLASLTIDVPADASTAALRRDVSHRLQRRCLFRERVRPWRAADDRARARATHHREIYRGDTRRPAVAEIIRHGGYAERFLQYF